MSWAWPAHTETDSSITLPAANPATAIARSSSRSRAAGAPQSTAGSNGTSR
jgi:hypothetical protein